MIREDTSSNAAREAVQGPTPVRRDRRRVRLGVALESEALTAVVVRRTLTGARPARIYNRSIEPPGQGSAWPALTDALGELRELVGGREATLHVALLRPLSHVKTLHLPPLRSRQLQMLLEQNAARFFPVRAGAAYSAHLGPRRQQRAQSGVFAAVAEAALVEAIVAVAEEAAFRIHAITAGPTAVAAGAVALNPELKRISAAVVLTPPGSLEVLLLDRGELRLARVLPRFSMGDGAGGPDARHATATDRPRESAQRLVDRIRSALQEAGELHGCQYKEVELFGPDDTVGPLAAALGALEDGRPVILPAADDVRALTPAALAAYGATTLPPGPLAFVTEVQRAWLRRNDRRRVTVLVGSALLCSAVAGAFRLADLHRELAAVREQRAAIQPSVREALDARAAIDALRARYTALMEIEANRPRRLELLAALAEALPNDAHLFSFEAGAEGVRVEGRAQSGATVASALEAAAAFRSALFVAPVRREDTPNGTFERFSLTIEPERDPSVEAKDGQRARRTSEGGAP